MMDWEEEARKAWEQKGWRTAALGYHTAHRGVYVAKATAPEWWQEETVSATDLHTRTFPPLRFVVPGLVPEGLALLAGKPKAKKSWLALDLAIAATADRFTLGEIKPEQGDALYLALEDSLRRVQRRMTKLLGMQKWPSRLLFKTTWKRVDQGGLDGIAAWAKSVERPTLVVVDVLERIRPMPSSSTKATPYSLDYVALAGLQALAAELQIAILVVTHVRKATADDVFDTISGTLGLTAAADTILVLGPKNGVMSLCVRGRDVEEVGKGDPVESEHLPLDHHRRHPARCTEVGCPWSHPGRPRCGRPANVGR